jgi:carboxyl-terminal processing protease
MPKRNLFVLLMMVVVAGVAWLARDRDGHGRRFAEVLGTIDRAYLEPVDQQRLFNAAMEGVFSRRDEQSAFVVGDRRDRLECLLDQEFGGVGLELAESESPRAITVVSPVLGSPAWHAGIAAGDRILAIDGVPTGQMALEDVFRSLRGRPGTPVRLSIATPASPAAVMTSPDAAADATNTPARDVDLLREIVKTESVLGDRRRQDGSWEWSIEGEPNAAIVRITSFGERTAEELGRALEAIRDQMADDVANSMLIVDLRGNAGGLLSSAVEVCDLFLDDGVIVSTRGRGVRDAGAAGDDAAAVDVRRASRGTVCPGLPVAVVIDGLTASAAEVVAACLQDHGRAIVVGSRSFGKGTVQSIMPLSDGSGLVKLTTSEYVRPSRVNIHRRSDDDTSTPWGVSPDRGCEITPTGRQLDTVQAWRQIRDAVPAKGTPRPTESPSHATLPRQVDPVLAKAVDAIRAGSSAGGLDSALGVSPGVSPGVAIP